MIKELDLPDLTYSISQAIFDKYPGYARGVVLAFGVRNRPSPDNADLIPESSTIPT